MLAVIALLGAIALPAELERFVPKDHEPVAVEEGDLNRDGRRDYVVIVESTTDEDGARTLFVITREKDGSLKLAAEGPKAALCRKCGGVFGDPFMFLDVHTGRFTVMHYAGSAWRWGADYTFAWSRRDKTWQLVRVDLKSFHTSEPDNVEKTVHRPPRDFGLIDLRDFDPADYRGKGKK